MAIPLASLSGEPEMSRGCRPASPWLETVGACVSVALFLTSLAWVLMSWPGLTASILSGDSEDVGSASLNSDQGLPEQEISVRTWDPPSEMVRGDGWTYELFSPPVIRIEDGTGMLVAGEHENQEDSGDLSALQDLEIPPVHAQPVPFVLLGVIATSGGRSAQFRDLDTGRSMTARIGSRVGDSDLVVETLQSGGSGSRPRVLLRDVTNGRTVELVQGRILPGEP